MKSLAIFCDGTWNSRDATEATNVELLAGGTPEIDARTGGRKVCYIDGVGSVSKSMGPIEGVIEKLGGGAFGWGLDARLEDAYRWLANHYEAGDRVYLFGFSRGGYTVRSLVGLLRNCGLPDEKNRDRIDEALALYRRRGPDSHPDAPEALRFRAGFSPDLSTGGMEHAEIRPNSTLLQVEYLGVWDTVGSLGIPDQFAVAALFNRRYKFHDLRLSSMVKSARHAVSIDERRKTYAPTLWDNLTDLNARADLGEYRQQWFPGNHGSVGGGGPQRGLSAKALLWVAEGAEKAGLQFEDAMLKTALAQVDVGAPIDNHPGRKSWFFRLLERNAVDRAAPSSFDAISDFAREKWETQDYRPPPLRPYAPRLSPAVLPHEW